MLKKTLLLTLSLVMVLSVCAFAGEGSDTIGACKLLPQLRYDYSRSMWERYSPDQEFLENWHNTTNAYYLQVNWGIFNNVDVIALIGGETVCASSKEFIPVDGIPEGLYEFNADPSMFLWGVGLKATFFRADNGFYVGGGALFTMAISDEYDVDRSGPLNAEFKGYHSTDYKLVPELHVGYHFKNIALTPYAGVDYVWSRSHVEDSADNSFDLRMEHPVYMFGGIDYYFNDKLYVNVEGRTNFIDGWGVGSGIGYKFDICAKPAPEPEPIPAPVIEPKLEPMSQN